MTVRLMVLDRHPGTYCLLAAAPQFDVVWAISETEALRRIGRCALDLAVLDVSVAGVQWLDLLQTIRQTTASEVIAVIPPGQLPLLRQFTKIGVDAIFQQDSEMGPLLRRISEWLPLDARRSLPWTACNQHVDHTLAYLARHFLDNVTVRQIAGAIGVSSGHLAHVFSAATGMTVKAFALRLKVELAKCILLSGDSTLADLAEPCGFCDASHLSRVFRQFERCSPGEFRARHRNAPRWPRGPAACFTPPVDRASPVDSLPRPPARRLGRYRTAPTG